MALVIDRTQGTGHSVYSLMCMQKQTQTPKHRQIFTKMTAQSAFVSALTCHQHQDYASLSQATDDVGENLGALSGSGARSLVSNASTIVFTITDMKPNQL